MARYAFAVVALTLVFALALASFHPWDLLIGAVLSSILLASFGRVVFGVEYDSQAARKPGLLLLLLLLRRAVAFVPFCLVVLRDIVVGTWEVALVVLHLRPLARPGIVAVPLGERTPTGIAVWAVVTGLPPGSFFVEVDREREVALIHVLDARNPEAFREAQEHFYRRYQSKVFP